MHRPSFIRCLVWVPLALLPIACRTAQGDQDREVLAPFELSADEIQFARELAERDLARPEQVESPDAKIVFSKIELLPEAQAQTKERRVLVAHYRYPGDETIHTYIDLNRGEVFHTDILPHFPTPLAKSELTRAEELARADRRLQSVLTEHGANLHLEFLVTRALSRDDPAWGHRLVNVSLRVGAAYLSSPRVTVDLTNETVHVE